MVLVRSHLDRDEPDAAYELLREPQLSGVADPGHRLLAARACLAAGHAEEALGWADGTGPEAFLLQARALLALERRTEGRARYDAAVAANPTLEDMELRNQLATTVRTFPEREDRPRLRVISNDDTDAEETARLLVPEVERVTFAEVGGLAEIKEQIRRRIILPFQKPSLFQRFKKRAGGGVLLYGPPGCGKTLLARATAGECDAAFLNVAISDVLDMYIGESERKLHALFEAARAKAPSVLFFDEIEALGGRREYTREALSAKLVSQFLSEMDGFADANAGVLVLGATNLPWAVDMAFRRAGRFDRTLFVPPPDRPARESILEILLRDRPLGERIDYAGFARDTPGFSGADLKNLAETAADEAIQASIEQEREVPITNAHLKAALREVKPTTLEWLSTARNYARYANEGGQYDDVLRFVEKHIK
jgi:transitional endoplasmic reticulum ATPase